MFEDEDVREGWNLKSEKCASNSRHLNSVFGAGVTCVGRFDALGIGR